MQWGNDVLSWLASEDGWRVISGAVIPALAILVAGIVAALIGRGATRRLITLHQRDALTAAVGGFVLAGRKAARWHELSPLDRIHVDTLIAEAETRIRLMPMAGSGLAANWASHQLDEIKRDSAGFQFQAQQTLAEYRDRLIAWSERPRSAKKLFVDDLDRWRARGNDGGGQSAPQQPADNQFAYPRAPESFAPPATSAQSGPAAPTVSPWQGAPAPSADSAVSIGLPAAAAAMPTGSTPLVITSPMPASRVRERVVPSAD
jgi:hypothetical protein